MRYSILPDNIYVMFGFKATNLILFGQELCKNEGSVSVLLVVGIAKKMRLFGSTVSVLTFATLCILKPVFYRPNLNAALVGVMN